MTNEAFQLQVDVNLAQEATKIFSRLGLDLQSAVQLFLNRSVQVRGIPFAMRLPDNSNDSSDEAIAAMKNMSRMAEEAGIADMTLDEINAEIDAVRRSHANS
ncbi:MAG: type II toxin-antitoxin system RelB/DinJ family antitoxin [Synergistaceae bacterium]|nr:type II toxin-antitoxin system RelB/DinJ family antitoxin [Synergistaceae bacterium]MBQ6419078.1 type II toxin-antitoxin system RelB/DinJ family antitoxin [Synergistaceae bacterium]